METDRLIDTLADDLRAAPPGRLTRRVLGVALAGGLAALALVATWLGFRPDLATAVGGPTFWMKAGYAAVLGAAGFWCVERLSRPAGSARRGLLLAAAVVTALAALGVVNLMAAEPAERLAVWLGRSWRRCPTNILILAGPALVLTLLVMRRFAPTRLRLAGAGAGLFAGGLAATAYGLHCPETAPAFVATWYSLGILLTAGVGALVGPWALRWR